MCVNENNHKHEIKGLAMKVLQVLLLVAAFPFSTYGGKFTVQGQILNLHDTAYVDFSYWKIQNGKLCEERTDSVLVSNGIFSVTGDVEELMAATIKYDNHMYRIYVEPCEVSVLIDANNPYLLQQKGTSVDDEIEEVRQYLKMNDSILYVTYEDYIVHPYDLLSGKERFFYYLKACDDRRELLIQYFKEKPQASIGSDLLLQALMLGRMKDVKYAEIIEKLRGLQPCSVRKSLMGMILEANLKHLSVVERFRETPVGNKAPDFIGTTMSGNIIQLSQTATSGNIILYFFTSNDRRHKEIDLLRSFLKNNNGDSISIIGVDLQTDQHKFRRYIKENKIPWPVIVDKWCDDLYQIGEWSIGSSYPLNTELPVFFLIGRGGTLLFYGDLNSFNERIRQL